MAEPLVSFFAYVDSEVRGLESHPLSIANIDYL
jgi:hypothetical protein